MKKIKIVLLLTMHFLAGWIVTGQSLISTFSGFNTNGDVYTIEVDEANNLVYVGGLFTHIGKMYRNGVAMDNTGAIPSNYPEVNGEIKVVIADGSGGFYIGGSFTTVGGSSRNNLAHINSSGTVTSWDPSPNNTVNALALSGSTLYAGGTFTTIGGSSRTVLAGIDTSTGSATSWNPSPNSFVTALEISGSTLYVGGAFTAVGGGTVRNRLASYDITTGNLNSWDPDVNGGINAIAVSSGNVFIGGSFTTVGGTTRSRFASIKSDGTLNSFDPSPNSTVNDILVSGGVIYISGAFTSIGGSTRNRIAAFAESDGTISSWNPNASSNVNSMVIDGSTMYIGGYFSSVGSTTISGVAAISTSTGATTSFAPGGSIGVNSIAISSGTLYIAGLYTSIGGTKRSNLAAINSTTGEITSWDPSTNGYVQDIEISGSTIYVGGNFTSLGGSTRNYIGAVSATTGSATSWDPGANNLVRVVKVSGSTVYTAGSFTTIGGASRNYIAALDASTGSATTWNPNSNNIVYDLHLSDNNNVYVGGNFTSIGGQTRNRIAELDLSTGNASTWNPNSAGIVYSIQKSSDGTVYAGGAFTTIGGQTRNRLAAIDNTGAATSWNPNANNVVTKIHLTSDGVVYAVGGFSIVSSTSRSRTASINSSGTLQSWTLTTSGSTYDIVTSGLRAYLGGSGITVGSLGYSGFVAVDRSPGGPTSISLSNSTISENQASGTAIGNLSSTDDSGDTHTYTLVSGTGSTDNGSFSIAGNQLQSAASLDYETKSSHSIRIRSTDQTGFYSEKTFTISVTNVVETGTDILTFTLPNQTGPATIDAVNHTVKINIGYGNSKTSLTPTLTVSSGGTVSPNSGVAQNFTSPVNYTVTAENGGNQVWAVTVQTLIPAGTYTIGSGGTFSSLVNAFSALNTNGISGNIRLEFLNNHTDAGGALNGGWVGEDSYTVTVTPASGATSVSISSANYTLMPNNLKNVTFDGNNVMSITSTATNRYTVWWPVDSYCTNLVFKNIKFYSALGTSIVARTSENVDIIGCTFEFYGTPPQENIDIINGSVITNMRLIGNKVIVDSRYDASAKTIEVFRTSDDDIVANNVIHVSPTAASTLNVILNAGLIYNNTIVVDGSGTISNIVGIINNSANTKIYNNIIDVQTSHTTATGIQSSPASLDCQYNHIYMSGADGTNTSYVEKEGTKYGPGNLTAMATVAPNTTVGTVNFVNASSNDFNLTGTSLSDPDLRGTPIAAVTTDFSGTTRSSTAPSKGAYEYANNIANITGFTFANQAGSATINTTNHTVNAEINVGQALTSITPTISLFAGASVSPLSGVARNFSSDLTYTVTAEAGNTLDWTVSIKEQNVAPTDIGLSASGINENEATGTTVGTLSSTDANTGDSHTYSFVSGSGDTDNGSFTLSGNELKSGAVFNQEVKSSYSVRIQSSDGKGGTYSEAFTITINNVAEAPTDITHAGFFLQINENNALNATVATLSTSDPDVGETYTYTLVAGTGDTDNGSFTISGNEVKASVIFNYEVKNSYAFRVQTSDGNGGTYQKSFTLNVLNQSEAPTNISLSATSINEKNAINDVIATLSSTDDDTGETHLYSLVSGTGDTDNASFNISGTQLRASAMFDYEAKSSYSIRVRSDDQNSGTFEKQFTISIGNVNDLPTDLALSATSISENLASGTEIGTLTTTDQDSGDSHTYSLKSGVTDNASFSITTNKLYSAASFDYETKTSYDVVIITNDGNGGTFEKQITVSVTDVASTVSNITLSTAAINENQSSGTTIGTLGVSGTEIMGGYTYTLVSGTGDTHNASFSISGTDLKSATSFNYESLTSASIRIQVTGAGGPFEKQFTITINNVAESPTDISLSNSSIQESLSTGTLVGNLTTTDPDVGETYTYSLAAGTGDTDNTSFTISGNQLKSAVVFDYETKTSYSVRIKTNDGNGNEFAKAFTISITDVGAMITDISLSGDSFNENAPTGTLVGNLSTLGEEVTGTYTYSLVSGTGATDNSSFTISGGQLLTSVVADFETKSSYSVRVKADDGVGGSLQKAFTLSVNNQSESPSDLSLSATSIAENNATGAVIGTLSTTDPDTGDTFTYSLVTGTGDSDNASFTISGNDLKAGISFNFESKSSYSVRVQTSDASGNTYQEVISISVTNVSEAPTNLSLSASTVAENSASGAIVGTLSTTDEDSGETYTYSLVSGSGDTGNSAFTISGANLATAQSFDFEIQSSYSIRVRTSDGNSGTFEKTLTISITDANDAPTALALSSNTIDENSAIGTTIGTFSTTDADAGQSHMYSLVAGTGDSDNASFQLTGSTLTNKAVFDFETKSSYSIRVKTDDSNGGTFESAFTISVNNVTGSISAFTLSASSVDENMATGTMIGSFATAGEDLSGTFTYSLVSGTGDSDNTAFSIAGSQLNAGTTFNYENRNSYSIRVKTDDGAGKTQEKQFTISVRNVAEGPTDLTLSGNSVSENTAVGTLIGTFATVDPDAGETFTYKLVAGGGDTDNASFTVVGNELKTAISPDFESKTSYAVRVKTDDGNGGSFEKAFGISILNVNEAAAIATPIGDESLTAGFGTRTISLAGVFSDADGDPLELTVTSSAPGVITAGVTGTTLTLTEVATGSATITVTATDPGGLTASDNFEVVISRILSGEASITAFTLAEQTQAATIDASGHTVTVEVDKQSNVSSLAPSITVSAGATVSPGSGTPMDFTTPVAYVVTAENGSQVTWTVTVTRAKNTEASILTFSLAEQTGDAVIESASRQILVEVSRGTDITNLEPVITVSDGATINPTESRDFSSAVVYTVTAEDNVTTVEWTVFVTVAKSTEAEILTFSLEGQTSEPTIDPFNHAVAVVVAANTDITNLEPVITVSEGATYSPSGPLDFASPVTITVIAEDGISSQEWVINVTVEEEPGLGFEAGMKVSVYPNPVIDFLTIEADNPVSARVVDLEGRSIVNDSGTSLTVDLGMIPSGIYLILIEGNGKTLRHRIIKRN